MSKSVATTTTTSSRKAILKNKPRATKSEVEAKSAAGRVLLAQLCADEGIEDADPDGVLDAAFGKRYAVLNYKDNYKPRVVVRAGKKWFRACAERGCTSMIRSTPGTPNTHCKRHGGGGGEAAAKRAAGRVLLAQLCADEGIEEADPDSARDSAFGTRYAVLNKKDNHKPSVMVRIGKKWKLACAERGCPNMMQWAFGTANTHCKGHGEGDTEVAAKRAAGRVLLAQLCADEGIEEAPPSGVIDAEFGKRYAVLNQQDNQNPRVVVRSGKAWQRACAERGCTSAIQHAAGMPNTHCRGHGGGPRCPGGANDAVCPLNNCIQVNESDGQVRYLKDGVQYCCGCYCVAFPDDELAKNAKKHMHAKEQAVRAFLEKRWEASHPALKWVMDRRVEGTRRRPDHRPLIHLLGVKSHDLVLETDENSHWFYLCADERNKEKDVHFWINRHTKPLFFVRMNPDAYDDPVAGERVPSCWGIGKDGIARVKPSRKAEWAARLEKLAQVVEEYLVDYTATWAAWDEADRPKPEVHTIELFYDDVKVKKNAATHP